MSENNSSYMVTVSYGARQICYAPGPEDTERVKFRGMQPKIGHRGPRPVVRLWKLVEQRGGAHVEKD